MKGALIPTPISRLPKYRHYKPRNLAVVRLNGRDYYLGKYGTPESWSKYHRLLADQKSGDLTSSLPQSQSSTSPTGLTVKEVMLAFLKDRDGYYRHADGTPTGELDNFRTALKPLKRLYDNTHAQDFGSKALKAVRQVMIESGLARSTINARISKLVRVFAWAVENELVPASVHHGLKTVTGLKKGRSDAKETQDVKPVPDANVDAIRPYVSRQVWAIVELQRLTGMRPAEVTMMRTCDLDTTGNRGSIRHDGTRRSITTRAARSP
jgi:integrase